MNKRLLHLTGILIVVTLGMTSCMRQSPQFASGHFNHHLKNNRHSADVYSSSQHSDKINALLPKAPEELLTASSDPQILTIAKTVNPIQFPLTHHFLQKNKKQVVLKSSLLQKKIVTKLSILKTDNTSSSVASKRKSSAAVTHGSDSNKLLCAVISFFIPPLGVILYERAITINFWIDLILTLLFWLPGFIFALIIILG